MKQKITQATLTNYRNLATKEKEIRMMRESMRDQLIAMLRAGATVEQGNLNATLLERSAVTLGRDKVIAAIGLARYEWLRQKVKPTIQVQLLVQMRNLLKAPAEGPWGGTTKQ